MSFTITCYTLFDITPTGITNRQKPLPDEDIEAWMQKRNSQCNFDTVIQAVSLRSQPEDISNPKQSMIQFDKFENFGFLFQQVDQEEYPCWSFNFSINHLSVFDDGISDLGALYSDCDRVPMIKCKTEWSNLPLFLDTTPELRNIYFKIVNE